MPACSSRDCSRHSLIVFSYFVLFFVLFRFFGLIRFVQASVTIMRKTYKSHLHRLLLFSAAVALRNANLRVLRMTM